MFNYVLYFDEFHYEWHKEKLDKQACKFFYSISSSL